MRLWVGITLVWKLFVEIIQLKSCMYGLIKFFARIDPLVAKARVALLAVSKAFEVGFNFFILEGDSLTIIQAIQGFYFFPVLVDFC